MDLQWDAPVALPWPMAMSDLTGPERLLVWSLRSRLKAEQDGGPGALKRIADEFERQFHPHCPRYALAGFSVFFRKLYTAPSRSLHFHDPACQSLCTDEAQLLTLVAACQNGDERLASVLARLVVHSDAASPLLQAANDLSRALLLADLRLPPRDPAGRGAPSPARAPNVLLH